MGTVPRGAVVNPVFAFIATPSTPTRGLATMVLVSAFVVPMAMSRFTPLTVVISIFINVAPTVIISLIHGPAFQIMTIRGFGVVVLAALALAGAAGGPPRPLAAAAAAPPFGALPVLLIPIRTIAPLRVPHRPGQSVHAAGDKACDATAEKALQAGRAPTTKWS